MNELLFELLPESDGGFVAECVTESIVTEGDTWEELRGNVRDAVKAFFFDRPEARPRTARLRLRRDEVITCG
jgi:predicted RNase H-like HicB family nuclease